MSDNSDHIEMRTPEDALAYLERVIPERVLSPQSMKTDSPLQMAHNNGSRYAIHVLRQGIERAKEQQS